MRDSGRLGLYRWSGNRWREEGVKSARGEYLETKRTFVGGGKGKERCESCEEFLKEGWDAWEHA
jgi:hypothetical protein